jgi:6-phosphofructokinase 1
MSTKSTSAIRNRNPLDGTFYGVGERLTAWDLGAKLPTQVRQLSPVKLRNPQPPSVVGAYRQPDARRAVLADIDFIMSFVKRGKPVPSFLEAGPREFLHYDPARVKAAIITSGGVAPGLNRVVHAIVQRHCVTYGLDAAKGGSITGICDGTAGLNSTPFDQIPLTPDLTRRHMSDGGSFLGSRRDYSLRDAGVAKQVAKNIRDAGIQILYVLGGDGSLAAAAKLEPLVPGVSVVCVPKTMDNDIPWVSQSFGFATSVGKAAEVLTAMQTEALSTRRVGIVELFGADSGFVAANAALAHGKALLVLVPEMFSGFQTAGQMEDAFMNCLQFLRDRVRIQERGGGIVVVAEGVGPLFAQRGVTLLGKPIQKRFCDQIEELLEGNLYDAGGRRIDPFVNRPRHHIRAISPNAADQTYCERLGALAVETALAGYTGCVVSNWLSEYVLVPLELAGLGGRKKAIATGGMFWKQVVLSTGQPDVAPGAAKPKAAAPVKKTKSPRRLAAGHRRK